MQDNYQQTLLELAKSCQKKIDEVKLEFKEEKRKLIIDTASKLNSYKIGDKVADAVGEIIIVKIVYTVKNKKPTCLYYGYSFREFRLKLKTPERKIYLDDII